MEVQMVARASGPFGELNRKQRLSSPQYPRDYLKHLIEIGVAVVTLEDKPEPPIEYKIDEKKSPLEMKPTSSLPAAPHSQKKTLKRLKDSMSSRSTQTIK